MMKRESVLRRECGCVNYKRLYPVGIAPGGFFFGRPPRLPATIQFYTNVMHYARLAV